MLKPATSFTKDNMRAGKAECKKALQMELGLPLSAEKPLLGFIGRLDHQKGPDIVLDAVPELLARNCQA